MTDARPPWDMWGIDMAHAVAGRADCTRRAVGAVLMRPDHTVVSTGYNGGPSKGPSCLKGECPRGLASVDEVPGYNQENPSSYDIGPGSCIALHAEQNALLRASWDEMADAALYVTCKPCPGCIRMITGTHIHRVVWYVQIAEEEAGGLGFARVSNGRFIEDSFGTPVRLLR